MPSLDPHYVSGIVLFCSSVVGCCLPFQNRVDVTPVRPLSTGIVFAVALCHLLPDASEILNTEEVTQWFGDTTGLRASGDVYDTLPVAETLLCLGVFLMLVIDQYIPCPHHQLQSVKSTTRYAAVDSAEQERELLLAPSCCPEPLVSVDLDRSLQVNGDGTAMAHGKIYVTEASIAIHSVIIGFSIGVNPDTRALAGLTVAMVFHQLFEGVALAMIAVQGGLGVRGRCVLVLVFASSLPCGIVAGLLVYGSAAGTNGGAGESDLDRILFQGVPNAVAAGMLLHIGFELLTADFGHHHHLNRKFPTLPLTLVFLGGAVICLLAVWA